VLVPLFNDPNDRVALNILADVFPDRQVVGLGATDLILGLGTRFAAIPVVIAMGVAALVVHANDPLLMGQGASKEPALLYAIPFLALVFTGGGRFSVDAWLKSRRG